MDPEATECRLESIPRVHSKSSPNDLFFREAVYLVWNRFRRVCRLEYLFHAVPRINSVETRSRRIEVSRVVAGFQKSTKNCLEAISSYRIAIVIRLPP